MTDSNNNTIVSWTAYNAANQPVQMWTGGFNETRSYNTNLQLTDLISGSLHYQYNYSSTQNNGRVQSLTDVVSGETVVYAYDSLTRLTQSSGTGDPGGAWNQNFTYDGFGNLLRKTASNACLSRPTNSQIVRAPCVSLISASTSIDRSEICRRSISMYFIAGFPVSALTRLVYRV